MVLPYISNEATNDFPKTDHDNRRYYYDADNRLHREIWRPGDGDGDPDTEYFSSVASQTAKPPPAQRWRFFQHSVRHEFSKTHMPPRYVLLDDRACWEIINSDIPKTHRTVFWSHDFAGPGKIRSRRAHRGRGVVRTRSRPSAEAGAEARVEEIVNSNDEAKQNYEWTYIGSGQKQRYYFTGEAGYQAVEYATLEHELDWPVTQTQNRTKPSRTSIKPEPDSPSSSGNFSANIDRPDPNLKMDTNDDTPSKHSTTKQPVMPQTGTPTTGIFFPQQPPSLNPAVTKTVAPGYFERLTKQTEACTVGEHEKLVAEVAQLRAALVNAMQRIELLEEFVEQSLQPS